MAVTAAIALVDSLLASLDIRERSCGRPDDRAISGASAFVAYEQGTRDGEQGAKQPTRIDGNPFREAIPQ